MPEGFQVVEHDDRTLVETEVLHRVLDLPVFDIEGSIPGKPRVQERLGIHTSDVPQAGDSENGLMDLESFSDEEFGEMMRTGQLAEYDAMDIHLRDLY